VSQLLPTMMSTYGLSLSILALRLLTARSTSWQPLTQTLTLAVAHVFLQTQPFQFPKELSRLRVAFAPSLSSSLTWRALQGLRFPPTSPWYPSHSVFKAMSLQFRHSGIFVELLCQ